MALVERLGPSCGRYAKNHPRLIDRSWPSWRSTRAPGPWDCRVVDSRDLWKWCWWTLSWSWWWWWWWWCLALQWYQMFAIFDVTPNIIMPKSQSCTTKSINSLAGLLPSTCATEPYRMCPGKTSDFCKVPYRVPDNSTFSGVNRKRQLPIYKAIYRASWWFQPISKKLLYFEWSPPWHVGWRLSGEGCHWEYDGKNGEFENIDFRFPWLSDTSKMGFGHDVPFLNYSDRLPHPSDLCQPDRVRWG